MTVIEWEYRSVRYQASSNRRLPLEDGDEDRTVQFCVEVAQAGGSEDPSRARTYKVTIISRQRRLQYLVPVCKMYRQWQRESAQEVVQTSRWEDP